MAKNLCSAVISFKTSLSVLCIVLVFFNNILANKQSAYFRSAQDFDLTRKIGGFHNLPDNTKISELVIMGTHNSMAYDTKIPYAKCQVLTITDQLNMGIRLLDARVRRVGTQFFMHHGPVFLHRLFGNMLMEIINWLKLNPKDFVILNIQEDYEPKDSDRSLCSILNMYMEDYGGSDIFTSVDVFSLDNAKIKDYRGKIIIIKYEKFDDCNIYGKYIFDASTFCETQTHWELKGLGSLYDKWELIKQNAEFASSRNVKNSCYVNFLGGNNPPLIYPDWVVSGRLPPFRTNDLNMPSFTFGDHWPDFPRFSFLNMIHFEGTNILFHKKYLTNINWYENLQGLYIIMTDFFGAGSTQAIWENIDKIILNKRLKYSWWANEKRGNSSISYLGINLNNKFKIQNTNKNILPKAMKTTNSSLNYFQSISNNELTKIKQEWTYVNSTQNDSKNALKNWHEDFVYKDDDFVVLEIKNVSINLNEKESNLTVNKVKNYYNTLQKMFKINETYFKNT